MGRPVKYTPEKLKEIEEKLLEYLEETDIPILAEFAYQNDIPRQKLYEFEELNDARKKIVDKKEAQLERLGLTNKVNQTMAIFSLKQLGWRDKQEVEHSGELDLGVVILGGQKSIDEWKKEHSMGTSA